MSCVGDAKEADNTGIIAYISRTNVSRLPRNFENHALFIRKTVKLGTKQVKIIICVLWAIYFLLVTTCLPYKLSVWMDRKNFMIAAIPLSL